MQEANYSRCHSIQHADIKGNHFIVNWQLTIIIVALNLSLGHSLLFQPMEVLSHMLGRSVFGKHTLSHYPQAQYRAITLTQSHDMIVMHLASHCSKTLINILK